jgi:hypothetical protein
MSDPRRVMHGERLRFLNRKDIDMLTRRATCSDGVDVANFEPSALRPHPLPRKKHWI